MNNFLLKSYLRCKRKAWLEFKGEKSYKSWSAHTSINLITEFNNFKTYTKGKLFNGEAACERGYDSIIGMKIKSKINNNLEIEIKPSLIVKTEGNSIWGKYKYIPAVSKLGRRTTKEHIFDLAICSIVLEKFQNSKIEHGLVISSYKNQFKTEKISINKKLRNQAIKIFLELNDSLNNQIPEITENRNKCSICSWQKFCDKEAKSNGLLTDIDGVGQKTALNLKKIGILNVKQLASYKESELDSKLSLYQDKSLYKISKIINQSKSYVSGSPIKTSNQENLSHLFSKIKNGLFVFDIESNPDEGHDFLYGFLTIKNMFDESKEYDYQPILNLEIKEKKKCFLTIIKKINSKNDWPILHYGETEKISIIKLAKKYSFSQDEIDNLKSRFIDLHFFVRDSWILPIKNYSLKSVANWMGFNWKQENVNGSKALFWWLKFKNTKNYFFLEKIIQYNRDDCLATLFIAKWLLEEIND